MTIRQAVRRKVNISLLISALFISLLLILTRFWPDASWAWVGVIFMLGAVAPLLYVVWLIDCPICHTLFGQRNVFNVAFALAGSSQCPNCGIALDGALDGP